MTAVPSDYATVHCADPNQVDDWLGINGYKPGAMAAFKSWALVSIQLENLRDAQYTMASRGSYAPRQPFQVTNVLGS